MSWALFIPMCSEIILHDMELINMVLIDQNWKNTYAFCIRIISAYFAYYLSWFVHGTHQWSLTRWGRGKIAAHGDVIKWKHFLRYWPFVRGIHRSPMNSPHKGHWRGALMFPLICDWINSWVNNCEAGDLRRHRAHYDVTAMHFADDIFTCIFFNENVWIRLRFRWNLFLRFELTIF